MGREPEAGKLGGPKGGTRIKIGGVETYIVGNPWKNWLFGRLTADEGLHGIGGGTLNGFARTVEGAIHELEHLWCRDEPGEFNEPWEERLLIPPMKVRDGYVSPPDGPGLGVELDLDEVSKHPHRQGNWLPLFKQGWERREGGE